jgi:U2-associated protein SR140
MGRMTEKTYRDEVNSILTVWKDEHLFDKPALEHLDEAFNAQERQKEQAEQERKLAEKRNRRKVAAKATTSTKVDTENEDDRMAIDAEDGEEITAPDGSNDGTPQATSDAILPAEPTEKVAEPLPVANAAAAEPEIPGETAAARARRLRPKAEDMFASDGE